MQEVTIMFISGYWVVIFPITLQCTLKQFWRKWVSYWQQRRSHASGEINVEVRNVVFQCSFQSEIDIFKRLLRYPRKALLSNKFVLFPTTCAPFYFPLAGELPLNLDPAPFLSYTIPRHGHLKHCCFSVLLKKWGFALENFTFGMRPFFWDW